MHATVSANLHILSANAFIRKQGYKTKKTACFQFLTDKWAETAKEIYDLAQKTLDISNVGPTFFRYQFTDSLRPKRSPFFYF